MSFLGFEFIPQTSPMRLKSRVTSFMNQGLSMQDQSSFCPITLYFHREGFSLSWEQLREHRLRALIVILTTRIERLEPRVVSCPEPMLLGCI